MDNPTPLGQTMVLGALEMLLNQALAMHPQGREHLARLAGNTVRVRAYEPDFIFYCLIAGEGIELTTDFDGDARIRVRGSAAALLHRALLPPGEQKSSADDGVQIDGDDALTAALGAALDTFNLWEAIRTWLREHVAMPELFGLLRQHDPAWMDRLQDMPQLLAELLSESRRQAQVQQQILAEVQSLRESLRAERRTDILSITSGIFMLAIALLAATDTLPGGTPDALQGNDAAWVMALLGIALMLSRLFGKRYETD